MRPADWFAERSARGIGAWLLVGPPVIAGRIWWSVAAAIAIFVVTVTIYVVAARRYVRRHHRQGRGATRAILCCRSAR
jgi:membrane protein implicated in regulation of membrane protease activity